MYIKYTYKYKIKLLKNRTCREIQNRTFREEVKISFNSQRPICGQMSGLAGAGNKTRKLQTASKPNTALDTKFISQTNLWR